MGIRFQNQLRSDCSSIRLGSSQFTPRQIQALSRCLNSHGDLGPIDAFIQSASDETLQGFSTWVNQEIFGNPTRLKNVEFAFDLLVRENLIDEPFQIAGGLLKDPQISQLITQHFRLQEYSDLFDRQIILFLTRNIPHLLSVVPLARLEIPSIDMILHHQRDILRLIELAERSILMTDQSPLIEIARTTGPLSPLITSENLDQISVLLKNGKLKSILHTVIKVFHSNLSATIRTTDHPPLIIGTIAEALNAIKANHTSTDIKNGVDTLFSLIRKNPEIPKAVLNTLSQFTGNEQELAQWFVDSARNGMLLEIEELVQSANVELFLLPNPVINYMSQISRSKDDAQTIKQIKAQFARDEKLANTVKFALSKNLKNKLKRGKELASSLDKLIGTAGFEFFKNLFLNLDQASARKHQGLYVVTELADLKLFTVLSHSLTQSSIKPDTLASLFKALGILASDDAALEFLNWTASLDGQRHFTFFLDYLAAHQSEARLYGRFIAEGLELLGETESPTLHDLALKALTATPEMIRVYLPKLQSF